MNETESINILLKFVKKDIAKLIIKSINNFSIQYSTENEIPTLINQIYESKFEEIVNALTKSPNLLNNEKDAINSAFMKPEELFPENYEKIIKKKN